jgi:hypothetical protein
VHSRKKPCKYETTVLRYYGTEGREFESLRARCRSPAGVSAIVPSTEPFGGPAGRPGREAYEQQLAEGAKLSFEQPARSTLTPARRQVTSPNVSAERTAAGQPTPTVVA